MSSGVNERMTHPWYEAISIKLFLGVVGALLLAVLARHWIPSHH